jgi:3-hydroxy-9,10-secoandrosta-1,3,5(10)-triene-9,17-dione monooxygenase
MLQSITPTPTQALTREELLARAESMIPRLAARSADCEKARMAPRETVEEYADLGLLRICQPARYGGFDLGYDVMCEVIQTLARGCGSQAWVHMVLADNPLKLAAFSLDAQDEVWGADSRARICVAIAAVGKAKRTPGGIVWTGLHGFSSGVDHADWVICGGNIIEEGKAPEGCFALIPTKEIELIDDWHSVGLAGSGSRSFKVNEVFVPQHRVLSKKDYDAGTSPGTLFYTAPISKLPRGGVSAVSYTAVCVGVAEGFLQNYIDFTAPRKSRGNAVADQVSIQMGIGQGSAEVEAASRLYMGAVRETMDMLGRGETPSKLMGAQGKRNAAFACQLAMSAVQKLFNAAGGRALYLDSVLQRQFRDCFAAAAHHSVVWDGAAAEYGKVALAAANARLRN